MQTLSGTWSTRRRSLIILGFAWLFFSGCGGATDPSTYNSGSTNSTGGATTFIDYGLGGGRSAASGGAGAMATAISATGGSTGMFDCANVNCLALPNSCKAIVQNPEACCPVCTDSGCGSCSDIACPSGTHIETPIGACCPECVVDQPSACETGQQNYAQGRSAMIEKYGSIGCRNSSECVIVPENNLCVWTCGIPLPTAMATSLENNLSSASSSCASCARPTPVLCELMVPACVNGKCIEANPQ